MNKREWEQTVGDELNLSVPLRQPPPDLESRIMDAVDRQGRKARPRYVGTTWSLATAAAILVLATGNLVQWLAPKPQEMMKPGLLVVMLSGTSLASKAFGTIVLDPDDNHGILAVRDLPVPKTGQYQLWLKKGVEIHSGGIFSVNSDGYGSLLLTIPEGFRGFQDFCLTLEPSGGSVAPTLPWVMIGKI